MLEVHDQHKEYFDEVVTFAKKIGKYDIPFADVLESLREASTRLSYSAGVLLAGDRNEEGHKLDRMTKEVNILVEKLERRDDNNTLKKWLDYLANYADHEKQGVTRCELRPDRPYGFGFAMFKKVDQEWKYWFNGGLLFHGSHDGFGSGAGPTFAVTVNPTDGWSIHT